MKRLNHSVLVLVIIAILVIPFTSCNSTSELLPLLSSPAKAEALVNDYETLSDRIDKLEKRVDDLEQKVDVVEEPTDRPTDSPDAYETELHNIMTATMAMMADSTSGNITDNNGGAATSDLDLILSDANLLSSYVTGLNADGTVKTGCTYAFTADGSITQTTP